MCDIMKRLFLYFVVLSLLVTTTLFSQIPRKISYQGILTDATGAPASEGSYDLQFGLYDAPTGGSSLFVETHVGVPVHRGAFKVHLGSVSTLDLPFDRPYFLETIVSSGPGISSPVTFDRTEFSSVPYALRTDTAAVAYALVGGGSIPLPYVDTTVVANEVMLGLANRGTGFGALFANSNTSNTFAALVGKTNGTGTAILGNHDGTSGTAGQFEIVNTSNPSSALYAHHPGSGAGVEGVSDVSGAGVKGTSTSGFGVAGYTSEGTGVYGTNGNSNTVGHAGYFNGRTRVTQDLLVDRYLGLGTASPATRLDIAGGNYELSSSEGDIRVGNGTYRLKFGIATGGGGAGDARIRAQGGLNRLSLGVNTSDVLTLYGGKVGIGQDNPVTTLHVSDATNPATMTLGVNSTAGGYTSLLTSLSAVSGGYAMLQSVRSAGSQYGDLVLNRDGGNVGIGNASPAQKLDVNGNINASGTINAAAFTVNGSGIVSSPWSRNGSDIYYNAGKVGIGTVPFYSDSSTIQLVNSSGPAVYISGYHRDLGVLYVRNNFPGNSIAMDARGIVKVVGGIYVESTPNTGILSTFTGDVRVMGTLTGTTKNFTIDHPLDPANKYLVHGCVESPERLNVYNGNVVTDATGIATVQLPQYFEALNKDFRYQLTVIGQFAQAIVASRISGNSFKIKTDKPNVEVSWQVTGTRNDAYVRAHPMTVEMEKSPEDRGKYLTPLELGFSEKQRIGYKETSPREEY